MSLYEELHEQLQTGHEIIDQQHQKIARAAAKLYEHLWTKSDPAEILKLLEETKALTIINFNYEEELMTEHKFGMSLAHKTQHDRYLDQIDTKIKHVRDGKIDDLDDFSKIIKNWVFNHIIGMDRKLISFLKTK